MSRLLRSTTWRRLVKSVSTVPQRHLVKRYLRLGEHPVYIHTYISVLFGGVSIDPKIRTGRNMTEQIFNLSNILIYVIHRNFMNELSAHAVFIEDTFGEWFLYRISVRQECLLSPTIILERNIHMFWKNKKRRKDTTNVQQHQRHSQINKGRWSDNPNPNFWQEINPPGTIITSHSDPKSD